MKRMWYGLVLLSFIEVAFAQGAPVFDAAHILESIHNGYQIYLQVQNLRQQLEYSYKSMQAQMKTLEQFDYSSINSFTDAVSFVDRQLSYVRQTENRLKNMRIKIGDQSYNLLEMYQVPGASIAQVEENMTAEMTVYDRANAWSHYGLRPVNYLYVETWKQRVSEASKKLAAMSDSLEEDIEESATRVDEILEQSKTAEGTTAQLQAQNQLLGEMSKQLNMINANLAVQGQLAADQAMQSMNPSQGLTCSGDFLE